jgi:uncharacterized damage-inducible protein DinB
MSALRQLCMLTRYSAWGNALLYQSLAKAPRAELVKTRPIVFGSILRTLNHVYSMDLVWRANLEGGSHGFTTRNPEQCPAFDELRSAQTIVDQWYVRYAQGLSVSAAETIMDFTFIGGTQGAMTRADMLLHVVNHTTYHRGHIGDMLYQIPLEPPTTDLPVFLRTHG